MNHNHDTLTERIRQADQDHGRTLRPTQEFAREVERVEEAIRGWLRGVWDDARFSATKRAFVLGAFNWTPAELQSSDSEERGLALAWLHRGEAARQQSWRIEVAMAQMDEVQEEAGAGFLGADSIEVARRYWVRWASDNTRVEREEDRLHYPFDKSLL